MKGKVTEREEVVARLQRQVEVVQEREEALRMQLSSALAQVKPLAVVGVECAVHRVSVTACAVSVRGGVLCSMYSLQDTVQYILCVKVLCSLFHPLPRLTRLLVNEIHTLKL